MANVKAKEEKSVVAITRGGRWEAKKVIAKGLDLIGGIDSVVKKGDVVILKPNLGYPEVPGMPPWTCTTDAMVLAALTELCLEAGAKKVRTGDMPAHHVRSSYMLAATGVQEAVEKVGGEVVCLDEEPFITRKVPGGILLKKQALPKAILDADVIINVPKIKPTRVGKWTLGFKNLFGLLPHEDRMERHRIPEHFYILTDLWRLVRPTLTVMDGFVIQEGHGPRLGTPVDFGVVIMGKDPVATETVTVLAIGHEPYEQMVLPIAVKQGLGKGDVKEIEIKGESLESVRRYTKVSPGGLLAEPLSQCRGIFRGCLLGVRVLDPVHTVSLGNRPEQEVCTGRRQQAKASRQVHRRRDHRDGHLRGSFEKPNSEGLSQGRYPAVCRRLPSLLAACSRIL